MHRPCQELGVGHFEHNFLAQAAWQAVLQIAATGGGWPLQLQERLLQLLQTPCEAGGQGQEMGNGIWGVNLGMKRTEMGYFL